MLGSGEGKVFFPKGASSNAALRNSGFRNLERLEGASRGAFVHGYPISLPTPTSLIIKHLKTE